MSKPLTLAIAGATGEVGKAALEALDALELPLAGVRLLASPRSAGQELEVGGEPVKVAALSEGALLGCDVAVLCTPAEVSKAWAPKARAAGCAVVDVSSAYRADAAVPLVVPAVNGDALASLARPAMVATPSPLATALALVLAPLGRAVRAVVATHLAPASGEGRAGVAELEKQSRDLLALREPEPASRFPHRLAFNAVPQAGALDAAGASEAERGAGAELRRVLGVPDLPVHATVVRVPVFYGDLVSVHLETDGSLDAAAVRERLRAAKGVKVVDDPASSVYPMPMLASQEDAVLVGRVRADRTSIDLVAVLEGPRRGAATTALEVARRLAAG
ncbi:MAG: aspartate-semialdehyde dehydrogenase [Anaeromyxobacter sp.]